MGSQPKTKVWRQRDKKDLMGINRGRRVATFACISDFLVARQGAFFPAEVKSFNGERFSYSDIRPAQRSAALMCAACDAPYWFFIMDMTTEKWYQLSGAQLAADIKAGIKSRRWEDLDPCTLM